MLEIDVALTFDSPRGFTRWRTVARNQNLRLSE